MRFKDYITNLRQQPNCKSNFHRVRQYTTTVKYHVPDEMQKLFGFTISELYINCFALDISDFLPPHVVITQDMLDYLNISVLAPHIVDKSVETITDVCNHYSDKIVTATPDDSSLWRELVAARNNVHVRSTTTEYNPEFQSQFHTMYNAWRTQVVIPFLKALVDKLDIVEFSDDESDTDGVSDITGVLSDSDNGDDDTSSKDDYKTFVVCERSGEYSDYDCEPVAAFDTEHKAHKFIKSVHKKMWTTKSVTGEEYEQAIRTRYRLPRQSTSMASNE